MQQLFPLKPTRLIVLRVSTQFGARKTDDDDDDHHHHQVSVCFVVVVFCMVYFNYRKSGLRRIKLKRRRRNKIDRWIDR